MSAGKKAMFFIGIHLLLTAESSPGILPPAASPIPGRFPEPGNEAPRHGAGRSTSFPRLPAAPYDPPTTDPGQ